MTTEKCIHCGHPVREVTTHISNRKLLLHSETGLIHCPNLSGRIACLPQGGVE